MTPPYGKPYTVRGWGDEVVTTVATCGCEDGPPDGFTAVVRVGDGPVILVPTAALTPVDTTPAEPEPGAWLISGVLCVRWFGDDCEDADYPWCSPLHSFTTFRAIWTRYGGPDVPIVRLVPEPAPVELPWEWTDLATGAGRVTVGQIRPTRVKDGNTWINVECAEAKGRALLSAARAAREATS